MVKVRGVVVWPGRGRITKPDQLPSGFDPGSEDCGDGYIWVHEKSDRWPYLNDGMGHRVLVREGKDLVFAAYAGYHFFIAVLKADWPFPIDKDGNDVE